MSHYKALGVAKDATPDQIKRAYRRRARETHPDKGGSASDFEPITKAYETLSDPARRLLYDTTGQDKRLPIEKEVQNILMEGFNRALASEKDIEVLAFVRNGLESGRKQIRDQKAKLHKRQEVLTTKREKITSTGENPVHLIIDGELKNIEGQLANFDHQLVVTDACLKAVGSYSEEWEAPPPAGYTTIGLGNLYGGQVRWK